MEGLGVLFLGITITLREGVRVGAGRVTGAVRVEGVRAEMGVRSWRALLHYTQHRGGNALTGLGVVEVIGDLLAGVAVIVESSFISVCVLSLRLLGWRVGLRRNDTRGIGELEEGKENSLLERRGNRRIAAAHDSAQERTVTHQLLLSVLRQR